MEKEKTIQLSVVDVEKKYSFNPAETVYGGASSIVSWGIDNDIPKLLGNCYEKSSTLAAAINQSVNYVLGDDILIKEDAAFWKEKINRRGQTIADLASVWAYDYYIYGNFAAQCIFNALGNVVEIIPLAVDRCRLSEDRTKVFYSKKAWTKYQVKSDEYGRFGFAEFDPKNPTQIFFWNGNGVRHYYNPAPWQNCLNDVLTEAETSLYCLKSTTAGFSAKYLLTFPDTSNLTDEQKKAIEDGIRNKFCGYDSDSNFMIYYANDEDKKLAVDKIEADGSPELLQQVRAGARANIFTSLRISPLLCGLTEGTSTGFASQEFSDSFRLFDRTVASPVRKIITDSINKIIGVEDGVSIVPFSIVFDGNN